MFDFTERSELLFGEDNTDKLASSSVLLFGLGGVGSYAAEALVRAGVGRIGIVDFDTVSLSNLNRQLIATRDTLGQNKTDAEESRLLSVNPQVIIEKYNLFYGKDNADSIDFSCYDYVIDAVDNVSAKLLIIEKARTAGVPVLSCMGTGNRTDSGHFTVTEIEKTKGDALARVMRKELRDRGITGVRVIYSDAPAEYSGKTIASVSFVPGVAGLMAAGEAVKSIIGKQA